MDKTNDLYSLAYFYHQVIFELPIDEKSALAAANAWNQLTGSQWHGPNNQTAKKYGLGFEKNLRKSTGFSRLRSQWLGLFNGELCQRDISIMKEFLRDVFFLQLGSKHQHHDFFCLRMSDPMLSMLDMSTGQPTSADFWALYFSLDVTKTDKIAHILLLIPGAETNLKALFDRRSTYTYMLGFRSRPDWLRLTSWAFTVGEPSKVLQIGKQECIAIESNLEAICATEYRPGDSNELLCINQIENCLIRLYRQFGQSKSTKNRLDPAVAYILENYSLDFSVEDVAELVHLSVGRVRALFKQHYGVSITQWRNSLRLIKAEQLLLHSEMTVIEISNAVGWQDSLYFSRLFKSRFGLAPSYYRQASA